MPSSRKPLRTSAAISSISSHGCSYPICNATSSANAPLAAWQSYYFATGAAMPDGSTPSRSMPSSLFVAVCVSTPQLADSLTDSMNAGPLRLDFSPVRGLPGMSSMLAVVPLRSMLSRVAVRG